MSKLVDIRTVQAVPFKTMIEALKNISDNSKVMGYPAKNIRDFLKDNK